jgi:hypothetical protein
VFAGVDWGQDGSSYTVLTLATYVNNRFRVFFIHRFEGADLEPDVQVAKIIRICRAYRVKVIGVDYGAGYVQNKQLIHAFGATVVQQYQYGGTSSGQARSRKEQSTLDREPVGDHERYVLCRSSVRTCSSCHGGRSSDALRPRHPEHLHGVQRQAAHHRVPAPAGPADDSFHSITFCFLASMLVVHARTSSLRVVSFSPSRSFGSYDDGASQG